MPVGLSELPSCTLLHDAFYCSSALTLRKVWWKLTVVRVLRNKPFQFNPAPVLPYSDYSRVLRYPATRLTSAKASSFMVQAHLHLTTKLYQSQLLQQLSDMEKNFHTSRAKASARDAPAKHDLTKCRHLVYGRAIMTCSSQPPSSSLAMS